jgi:hypothetical protein
MSFSRHEEIYRSDVGLSKAGSGNWCRRSQCPSAAMSFQSAIPWPVALRQSLPPLHRLETILHNQHCRTMILQRTATTPLTSCLSSRVHSSFNRDPLTRRRPCHRGAVCALRNLLGNRRAADAAPAGRDLDGRRRASALRPSTRWPLHVSADGPGRDRNSLGSHAAHQPGPARGPCWSPSPALRCWCRPSQPR